MAMTGEIDALGDVVTGAALAQAVEPPAGSSRNDGRGPCRNCAAPLSGRYCSACGQKAVIHRTLAEFGHDIVHGVVHFDGKIWRTLPLLAWRPGELTRRYVHGERAKFVSPFALFLFSVFLMVAVFSWLGPTGPKLDDRLTPQQAAEGRAQEIADVKAEIVRLQTIEGDTGAAWMDPSLRQLQQRLAHLEKAPAPQTARAAAESRLALQRLKAAAEMARLRAARAEAVKAGQPVASLDQEIAALATGQRLMTGAASTLGPGGVEVDWVKVDLGVPALNAIFRHGLENPQLTLYKVQSNAYKFSWALIPISVPFVWLLFFWRRDLYLFDHAVFVTYSIAFMTLLASACVIAIQVPAISGAAGLLLVLYPVFHMYRQLRGAYQINRLGAVVRTSLLATFAAAALLLFGALVLALGLTQ